MTTPEEQPKVGDFLARLEFKYDNDVLDFLKTGKGVVVVEDKIANIPLPQGEKGDKGDIGQLREGDVRYIDQRTEEAEAAAEASEASAGRAKTSETKAKTSETNAKASETNAKASETKAKTSETNAKASETNAKASETKAKASETEAARQAGLSAGEAAAALAHKEQTGRDRTHVDSQKANVDSQVEHVNRQKKHVDDQVKHVDSQREHIDTTTAEFTTESAQAFARVESAATRAEDAQAEVELVVEDTAGAIREHVKGDADRAERSATKAAEHEEGAGRAAAEATKAEVDKLVAGAPEAFDTLKEISDELEKNETDRAALATSIGKKADREYVDKEINYVKDNVDGQGASIIPFNSVTGRQRWADGLVEVKDEEAPTGRYYTNGEGWEQGRNYFFQVDPDMTYYVSMWVKADKPGSRIYIELRDQSGRHAVQGGNLNNAGTYILGNYELPTEWTLLESRNLRLRDGAHRANINTIYFNHSNGSEREAVQMLTDIQFIPLAPHTHESSDVEDATSIVDLPAHYGKSGKVLKTQPDGQIKIYTRSVADDTDAANKNYVDIEVAKKADTGHEHSVKDIADLPKISTVHSDNMSIVQRTSTGNIDVPRTPGGSRDAASKGYVDGEVAKKTDTAYVDSQVAKKADTGHQHPSADITDTVYRAGTSDTANKVIAASGTGRLYYDRAPGTTDEIVNRKYVDSAVSDKATKSEVGKKADTAYVDQELGKKSDAGHTHSIDQELEKYLPGELDARVPPKVAEVIGGDRVIYDAAAAAVGEAADDIKWHHGTVSVDVTSLDDLPDGVHAVAAAVVARNLGLPGSLGTIQIQRIISGRTALYISQKTATQDLSVWVTSLNSGVWSEWERVSSENHYAGEIPDGANADDYRTPGQAWGVRSNRNITGLPVDNAGSLEVLSTGGREIQRFTTWQFVPREFTRASTSTGWYPWSQTGAEIADEGGEGGTPGLKTVPLALTAGVGGDGATSGTFRTLVQVGAPITRWRLHIGNIHPRTGDSRGGFTLGSVSVGTHAGDGARDEAQSLSASSVTVADGEEWVSPWVDGVDLTEEQVIEYDFSGAARTYLTLGTGWEVSASRTTAVDRLPLWLWIEAETYSHTPVVALIGDSTGAGHGSDQPVHGAALAIAGRKHGFLPVLYAHSGDTLEGNGDYDEDFSFQRWDHLDRPDSVIIQAGSNDIHSGNSLAELQRRFANAAGAAHRLAPVVFGGSVKPRDPAHADYDGNRVAYNDWLGSQPEGIRGVVDFSAAVAPNGTIPNGHSADSAHLNAAGHSAMATALDDITVARPGLVSQIESVEAAMPIQGDGFPEGKVTAPVGSIYTDRLATAGAVRWIKTSGTGNTGWKVEYGDTGQRVITHNGAGGALRIQRTGNTVTFGLNEITLAEGRAAFILLAVPYGFRPTDRISLVTHNPYWEDVPSVWGSYNGLASNFSWLRKMDGSLDRPTIPTSGTVTFLTDDPWPTSLPGTPA